MTPQEVLDQIQAELTTVMGPLAPLIVRDKAAEFDVSVGDFPPERMPELVEEVSFEIQNCRKKVQFQRAALRVLRELPPQPVADRESQPRAGEAAPADGAAGLGPDAAPGDQETPMPERPVRKSSLRLAPLKHTEGKT